MRQSTLIGLLILTFSPFAAVYAAPKRLDCYDNRAKITLRHTDGGLYEAFVYYGPGEGASHDYQGVSVKESSSGELVFVGQRSLDGFQSFVLNLYPYNDNYRGVLDTTMHYQDESPRLSSFSIKRCSVMDAL